MVEVDNVPVRPDICERVQTPRKGKKKRKNKVEPLEERGSPPYRICFSISPTTTHHNRVLRESFCSPPHKTYAAAGHSHRPQPPKPERDCGRIVRRRSIAETGFLASSIQSTTSLMIGPGQAWTRYLSERAS